MDEILKHIDWSKWSPWLALAAYILLSKWDSLMAGVRGLFYAFLHRRNKQDEIFQNLLEDIVRWSEKDITGLQQKVDELEKKIDFTKIAVERLADMVSIVLQIRFNGKVKDGEDSPDDSNNQ